MKVLDFFENLPNDFNLVGAVPALKMLKLYAFNAYFNADNVRTDDVENGITFSREAPYAVDGIFLNETLDEDTIELLYSYYLENNPFDLKEVFSAIDFIGAVVENICKNNYSSRKEVEDRFSDLLDAFEGSKPKVIVRVLTDYIPGEEERYEIEKKVSQHYLSAKGVDISAAITFGDDIINVVNSNKAPFDFVAEGKVVIDSKDNILKYKDNSFICNISAFSLKKLWKEEGERGLLAMNLRYYIKAQAIDDKIEHSLFYEYDNFWYLNNGIIIVCNDYNIVDNEIRLKEFSIVNGGQTTRMIGTVPFQKDFYISCKIIKNTFENSNDKNEFISKVAEASNTQKPIKTKDIIANRLEQRNLKTLMQDNNVFIEIKRGEKYNHDLYKEPWQRTKNNELAQDLYSFTYLEPGPARNSVSKILENQDKYDIIFKNHEYSFDYLRDVLFLEKAYKEYQKKVNKEPDNEQNAAKKGLVKNGMTYALAVIGYVLKIVYNKEYMNDMYKYRNNDSMFGLYSPELAFMHGFIKNGQSYKDFAKSAIDLFDFVFAQLIILQFEIAKSQNPSIAYSNWMKSNTGFNAIRKMINIVHFDNKQTYIIDAIKSYFRDIDDDEENANIDRYYDYCKKNKKIKAKDLSGNELSENDKGLRNELMVFRLTAANENHVKENKIFTDKMLEKLVYEKPVTPTELQKILPAATAYHQGSKILEIIAKYL